MNQKQTYNTRIYTLQGGDVEGIKSDGRFKIQNGAYLSIESGGILDLEEARFTMEELADILVGRHEAITIGQSTDSMFFSVIYKPYNARYITLSMTSNNRDTSEFWLTSCSAGKELHLKVTGGSTENGIVLIRPVDGVSILAYNGEISGGVYVVNLRWSVIESVAGMYLVSMKDNIWSIIDRFGDVSEYFT